MWEKIWEKYQGKGVIILGVPSNDFGQQEPGTSKDIKKRNSEIEKATIEAAEVPLEILELSIKCLENIIQLSKIGNPNSITDVGVALYLLYAAAKGASMNIIFNANDLQKNKKNKFIDQIEYYNKQADDLFNKINIIIDSHIK